MKKATTKLMAFLMFLVMLFDAAPLPVLAEEQPLDSDTSAAYYSEPKQMDITLPEYTLMEDEFTVSPVEDMQSLISAVNKPVLKKRGLLKAAARNTASQQAAAAPASITGYAAFDIKPAEGVHKADSYSVPVSFDEPIDVFADNPEENASIVSVSCTLYHFLEDGSYTVVQDARVNWADNLLTGFTFTTDGFSAFLLKYTVEYIILDNSGVVSLDFTDYAPYPAEGAESVFVYDTARCDVRVPLEAVLAAGQTSAANGVAAEGVTENFEIDLKNLTVASAEGGVSYDEANSGLIIAADGSITLSDGTKTLTVNVTGITRLSEEILTAEGVEIKVEEGNVPLGSQALYTAHSDEETAALVEQFKLGEGSEGIEGYRSADLRIVLDQEEINAEGRFQVTLDKAGLIPEHMKLDKLYHIHGENVEELAVTETEDGLLAFEVANFSAIVASYTVDFYYGDYEYHLPGGNVMTLSALFSALEIDRDAADVVNVVFSDPALLRVEKAESDTTLGAFITALGLEMELTEEEAAAALTAGDWALISLQPFDTTENMTIGFADGDQIVVRVEDATAPYTITLIINDVGGGYLGSQSNQFIKQNDTTWILKTDTNGTFHNGVTAYKNTGYHFVCWVRDDGAIPDTVVSGNILASSTTVTRDTSYYAYFAQDDTKLVRFLWPEHGTVTYTNGGFNNPAYYAYIGENKELHIEPNDGYKFNGWYSDSNELITANHTLTANDIHDDMTVWPKFVEASAITITYKTKSIADNGTVYGLNLSGETNNANTVSESLYEGHSPKGAYANNYTSGSIEYRFICWKDSAGNIVSRERWLVPDRAYSSAEYTAEYCPSNKVRILLTVNDKARGSILSNNIHYEDQIVAPAMSNGESKNELRIKNDNGIIKIQFGWGGGTPEYTLQPNSNYFTESIYFNGSKYEIPAYGVQRDFTVTSDGSAAVQECRVDFGRIHKVTYDIGDNSAIYSVGITEAQNQVWCDYYWCPTVTMLGSDLTQDPEHYNLYTGNVYGNMYIQPRQISSKIRIARDTALTSNLHNNLLTHSFVGWIVNDDPDNVIGPDDSLYVDGDVKLTAKWRAYFDGKTQCGANDHLPGTARLNTNSVGFFVRLFDTVFDIGNTGTYTDCLYTTKLIPVGPIFEGDGLRDNFYGYDREIQLANLTIYDSYIRENWKDGITSTATGTKYEKTILRLLSFPSDEFIFQRIRLLNGQAEESMKIKVNNRVIPNEELTTTFFDIKWYVLKDMENSWHIDGMLIPKFASLVVKKTFVGDAPAVENVTTVKDYYIGLATEKDGSEVFKLGIRADQTDYIQPTAIENGQYIWVLENLKPNQAYFVTEHNYVPNIKTPNGQNYTTSKSYIITNTPQTTNIAKSSATAPVDHVYTYLPDEDWHSYQTVAFTNKYVKPRELTLVKVDGTTNKPLSNVPFTFTLYARQTDGTEIPITMDFSTDAKGMITVPFPMTTAQGISIPDGTHRFAITEKAYTGYQALGSTIEGTLTLSSTENSTITLTNTSDYWVESNDQSIVYVKNNPTTVWVKVQKSWVSNDTKPVTMQLMRDGIAIPGNIYAQQLNSTNSWQYIWTDLPAYVDGQPVSYSVREEWIGEPGADGSAHYTPQDDADGYVDYIVTQSQSVDGSGNITVNIQNEKDEGQAVFAKVNRSGVGLQGAVFGVYSTISGDTVSDEVKQVTSDANGVVKIDGLSVGTYYVQEITPPTHYKAGSDIYQLTVRQRNSSINIYDPNTGTVGAVLKTVVNEPNSKISFIKKNENGQLLPGATFSLYRYTSGLTINQIVSGSAATDLQNNSLGNKVTGGDGVIFTGELAQGIYLLAEDSAPSGYKKLNGYIYLYVYDWAATPFAYDSTGTRMADPAVTESNGVKTYTFTISNTPLTYGDIELVKTVSGTNPDASQQFAFTITILNDDNFTTNTGFNGTYGDATFTNGVATVTVTASDNPHKKITGLPDSTRYRIVEANYSSLGYRQGTVTGSLSGIIQGANPNSTVQITVDNVRSSGSLTVRKSTLGTGADTEKAFNFTVTIIKNENGTDVTDTDFNWAGVTFSGVTPDTSSPGVASFTLKHGEYMTATGLPDNTRYTVTETDANTGGYWTKVNSVYGDSATGQIANSSVNEVVVENMKYETVTVKAKKAWKNPPENVAAVQFTLYSILDGGTETLVTGVTNPQTLNKGTPTNTSTPEGAVTSVWNGEVSWAGLPKADVNGHPYTYIVRETGVSTDGATFAAPAGSYIVTGETGLTFGEGETEKTATITNTPQESKVYVVKRWYDAYGNWVHPDGVTMPSVTVQLYKDGGSAEGSAQQITPGQRAEFTISDPSARYYVQEETTTFANNSFTAAYAAEPLSSSVGASSSANQVTVQAGGTLYVMNTPAKSTDQTVAHKKWVEFLDQNGTFYFAQLDGYDTSADAIRQNNMQIDVILHYKAIDMADGTTVLAEGVAAKDASKPADDYLIRLWFDTDAHHVITMENLLIPDGESPLLYFVGTQSDWKWGFLENTGIGQGGSGIAGKLPAYGYSTVSGEAKLVKYEYYYTEEHVYDGSDHYVGDKHYTWSNPENVDAKWWKKYHEQSVIEETLIENRPLNLPVVKQWKEYNNGVPGSLLSESELYKLENITVTLYASVTMSGTEYKWVHSTLTLQNQDNWEGRFENLERTVSGKTVTLVGGGTAIVSGDVTYSIEESAQEWYKRMGVYIVDHRTGQLVNMVMPTGSIKIQKNWESKNESLTLTESVGGRSYVSSDSDNGATAVILSLGRVSNNQVDADFTAAIMADIEANPGKFGLTSANLYTKDGTTYLKIPKTANGWEPITVSNLLSKRVVTGATPVQDTVVDCWYYVTEIGYLYETTSNGSAVEQFVAVPAQPDSNWTVTYTGTETQQGHAAVQAKASSPDTLTVTNAMFGSLTFTKKDADGTHTLQGAEFKIIPDGAGADNYITGIGNSGVLTSGDNGVVTIPSLPIGTYWLQETKAPAGYNLDQNLHRIEIRYGSGASKLYAADGSTETTVIPNTPGIELPATGGPGTAVYTVSGLSVMAAALWLIMRRRRAN